MSGCKKKRQRDSCTFTPQAEMVSACGADHWSKNMPRLVIVFLFMMPGTLFGLYVSLSSRRDSDRPHVFTLTRVTYPEDGGPPIVVGPIKLIPRKTDKPGETIWELPE